MDNRGYILCHHHSKCEDRPAVAQCSKCGKGLCVECADKLKSADGKVVCVDCLNEELAANAVVATAAKNSIKKRAYNDYSRFYHRYNMLRTDVVKLWRQFASYGYRHVFTDNYSFFGHYC